MKILESDVVWLIGGNYIPSKGAPWGINRPA
jgi:hypothetical protein